MTPELFRDRALVPALSLLPDKFDTPQARALVVGICLQESRLLYRRQLGNGPARSYAQFELGGVRGVLTHTLSRPLIRSVLTALDYDPLSDALLCWTAIEHNDILAAVFARLLLFTLPEALPGKDAPDVGWKLYVKAWRPGAPRRETWDAFYAQAWGST